MQIMGVKANLPLACFGSPQVLYPDVYFRLIRRNQLRTYGQYIFFSPIRPAVIFHLM